MAACDSQLTPGVSELIKVVDRALEEIEALDANNEPPASKEFKKLTMAYLIACREFFEHYNNPQSATTMREQMHRIVNKAEHTRHQFHAPSAGSNYGEALVSLAAWVSDSSTYPSLFLMQKVFPDAYGDRRFIKLLNAIIQQRIEPGDVAPNPLLRNLADLFATYLKQARPHLNKISASIAVPPS